MINFPRETTDYLSTFPLQNQYDDQTYSQTYFPHSNGSATNNQQQNFMGRSLVQSPNVSTNTHHIHTYPTSSQQYHQNHPINISNSDNQITSIENDLESLTSAQQQNDSDNIWLDDPAQSKNQFAF